MQTQGGYALLLAVEVEAGGFTRDADPSSPDDFQGHHLSWHFKIDLLNQHRGRGLYYPTEAMRNWRMMAAASVGAAGASSRMCPPPPSPEHPWHLPQR